MYCTQCGTKLKEGVKFCTQCGLIVKNQNETVQYEVNTISESVAVINDNDQNSVNVTNLEMPKAEDVFPKGENKPIDVCKNSMGVEKTKKKKGRLVFSVIVLVVLIIVISGMACWMMGGKDILMDIFGITESFYNADEKEETEVETEDELTMTEPTYTDDKKMETEESKVVDVTENIDEPLEGIEEEIGADNIEESESEYILENSDTIYLSRRELYGLSAEECRIARNELYARHGRLFDDEELQAHFNSCSWYVGSISAKDFSEDILNEYEVANRDLIVEYEKEMGYR